jgi:hypothetical protein
MGKILNLRLNLCYAECYIGVTQMLRKCYAETSLTSVTLETQITGETLWQN